MPRETPGKHRILRAALELYGAQGHEAVSLREIAQRAQVSMSLIVHYYRTKRGVVLAVDEALVDEARSVAQEVFATHARRPPRETAVRIGDALFQAFARPAATRSYLRRALLDDRDDIHDALKARVLELAEELVALVLPAEDGATRNEHAAYLLAMVLGHVALGGMVKSGPVDVESARLSCRSGLRTIFHDLPAGGGHGLATA